MIDPDADNNNNERIRAAAAAWVVRLGRRPSTRAGREFDRWLVADPRHAAAYRRVAERFDAARILRGSQTYAARPAPVRRQRPVIVAGALAAILLAVILILPFVSKSSQHGPVNVHRVATTGSARQKAPLRIVTGPNSIKSVGLADGSVVTLDNGSIVETAFTPSARRLTLVRGRARFTVAHEKRPFAVFAGGGSVLARGTVFDVSLTPAGNVGVSLLQGIVDVAPALTAGASTIRRLQQDEQIDYAAGAIVQPRGAPRKEGLPWIVGAFEFDDVPLGYVLHAADHNGEPSIVVTDASLASLRVSGRFDTRDRHRLAKNLARLFDLRVRPAKDVIELSPR